MVFLQIDIAMRENAKSLYALELKSIGRGSSYKHSSVVFSCTLFILCLQGLTFSNTLDLGQGR
jgi:hypothetical protein